MSDLEAYHSDHMSDFTERHGSKWTVAEWVQVC